MKITQINQTNNAKNNQTSFKSFIKLELPMQRQSKTADSISKNAIFGLENIARYISKIADGEIDIYRKKPYNRNYMPACANEDARSANIIFIDDQNGQNRKGLDKIIAFLIDKRNKFTVIAEDLFLEVPHKNKLVQRFFGSSYPNLANYVHAATPEQIEKLNAQKEIWSRIC